LDFLSPYTVASMWRWWTDAMTVVDAIPLMIVATIES